MGSPSFDRHVKNGLLLAGALALAGFAVRRAARRAEQKFPPRGKFIDVDGLRLHYLDHGSGPAILLLHGNGSQAADFLGCRLIERLAERYRVIAIDRPGFGYSERPRDRRWTPEAQARLLKLACERLGVREAIVVGHSFGTLVALSMALAYRDFVRGLVLVSGYYFPTPRLDAWLLSLPAVPLIGDILRHTLSPLIGSLLLPRVLRKIFSPRPVDPRFVAAVPPPLLLRPWQLRASAEESAFMVPSAAALSRRYPELAQPVEILGGTGDKIVRQGQQAPYLQGALPQGHLQLIAGEGHMLHYAASDQILAAVERIIARAE